MKVFLVGIPPSPQKVVQNLGGQWSRFAFLGSGTSQVIRISMSSWNHPQIRHHPPGIPLKCEFWYYLCFGKGVPGYPTSTVTIMAFTPPNLRRFVTRLVYVFAGFIGRLDGEVGGDLLPEGPTTSTRDLSQSSARLVPPSLKNGCWVVEEVVMVQWSRINLWEVSSKCDGESLLILLMVQKSG